MAAAGGTGFIPERGKLRIAADPRIGEIYFCVFPEDSIPPEFGKDRPVIIVSPTNKLGTISTVVPLTRSAQDPITDPLSMKLSIRPDPWQTWDSWVIPSHVYTVSHWRLMPYVRGGKAIYPRVGEKERQEIIDRMQSLGPGSVRRRWQTPIPVDHNYEKPYHRKRGDRNAAHSRSLRAR